MKKSLLIRPNRYAFDTVLLSLFLLMNFGSVSAQSVAPQIQVNDCEGKSHNLIGSLQNGKIIVIGWTMPCAACAGPLLEVHNAILNFELSHPGTVEYWLVDDYANTSCNSTKDWAVNNGINNATYFSDYALNMNGFGGPGMPKVVVVACADGEIYYNVNNSPTGVGVTEAINNALSDMDEGCLQASSTHHNPKSLSATDLTLYPNPAFQSFNIHFADPIQGNGKLSIFDELGQMIKHLKLDVLPGEDPQIDVGDLAHGVYWLQFQNDSGNLKSKLLICP